MIDYQHIFTLFLIPVATILLVRLILATTRTSLKRPPSPTALPIIGHLHLLAPIPHQALHKLSGRYGPLFHIKLGSVPCVVASSAEVAKEFLKTHEGKFSDRPISTVVDQLTYGLADFSFARYGPYWKFMKKLCMSQLLGSRTLDHLSPVRKEEIWKFLQCLRKKGDENASVDVGAQLIKMTNNIISRMIMSQSCSDNEDEGDEVRHLIEETARLTGEFNSSDFIWFCKNLDLQGIRRRTKKVHDKFDSMMERILKERETARKLGAGSGDNLVKDLLHILLDISEDANSEMKLTRKNIKAFILDLFAAGTDTSAITTEWALAELINQPEIMQKARKEIESVVGTSRLVEESDIPNLPYLQAVVKETLRLHPAGPIILRESTEACTVNDYEIPAGTRLFVNVWAIGRDPNYWENPLVFNPDRFYTNLNEVNNNNIGRSQIDVRGQHFQLLPFGSGRRSCPGTTLALQLVQAGLGAMIQCFDWRVSGGGSVPVDMEEAPGLTLPRAHPLVCLPVARLDPFPNLA